MILPMVKGRYGPTYLGIVHESGYAAPDLGISVEDFEAPEYVGIPLDCQPIDPNAINPLEKKTTWTNWAFRLVLLQSIRQKEFLFPLI